MNLFNRIRKRESFSVKEAFESFLKRNNINADKEIDKEDSSTDYYFSYQSGNFRANIGKNEKYVSVFYPSFLDVSTENVDALRSACNHFNINISVFRVAYTYANEHNKLHVHLSFHDDLVEEKEFANRLMGCFYYQRKFTEYIEDAIKDAKGSDVEDNREANLRRTFLINQQEINHQIITPEQSHVSADECYSLSRLLDTVLGHQPREYTELVLTTPSGAQVLTDAQEIANADIVRPVVNDDVTGFNAGCSAAVVKYRQVGDNLNQEQYINLSAVPAGCDDTSCYVRLTLTCVPMQLSPSNTLSRRSSKVEAASVIVAVDRQSAAKKQQEFKYMWEDALIKEKNGETLTDDQYFLVAITRPEPGFDYYWGMRHFRQGRYYEAIVYLENAFDELRQVFYTDEGRKLKDVFYEVCYNLGFCYVELQNYPMAFYYLNIVGNAGNISYTSEYINALANSSDIRSLIVIDNVIADVKEAIKANDDEEAPEHLLKFLDFLLRRKGYMFIDYKMLDKAEDVFKALLDSPYSHDYAINELAYIQRMRTDDGNQPVEGGDEDAGVVED